MDYIGKDVYDMYMYILSLLYLYIIYTIFISCYIIPIAILRYLIFYGFCIPRVTENRSVYIIIAASSTQACYEDFKSTICIVFKKK